jgi:hypothetical protein
VEYAGRKTGIQGDTFLRAAMVKVFSRAWVWFVDDERALGHSIIITLKNGWFFKADPTCGVRGFDTWAEVRAGCTRDAVYRDGDNV